MFAVPGSKVKRFRQKVLAVFRPLVLLVLRVVTAPKCSQHAQYARSMKYTIIRPSMHCVDSFMPSALQKTFTDGPTRRR